MTYLLRDNLDRTHRLRLVHVRSAGNWSVATRRRRSSDWREWLALAILVGGLVIGISLLLLLAFGLFWALFSVLLAIGRALTTGGM